MATDRTGCRVTAGIRCHTPPAYGERYDYIRGNDVYEQDYQYGLDYDGLSRIPQTDLKKDSTGSTKNAENRLQRRALELQKETAQPSMTQKLKHWQADIQMKTPGKASP